MMKNNPIPSEFTEKISKANQLYREAFLTFLPESSKEHLQNIQSELVALCKDFKKTPKDSPITQNVKKVTID